MKKTTFVGALSAGLLGLGCFLIVTLIAVNLYVFDDDVTEEEFSLFLYGEYEKNVSHMANKLVVAQWNYQTDLNNIEKQTILLNVTLEYSNFVHEMWEKHFKHLNYGHYENEKLQRQAEKLSKLGTTPLDDEQLKKRRVTIEQMSYIYGTAKICPYQNQNCSLEKHGLSLEPDIENIFAKSTDLDELVYIWKAWRDASGAKMRELYKTYTNLSRIEAIANGFENASKAWTTSYETATFIEDINDLWAEVEPLYVELHKYVGRKLREFYGDELDLSDGLIPAHVFGNMWAQEWNNIAQLVKPFPNASKVDVDQALTEQNYTVLDMFETADEFYQSMGLIPNSVSYNTTAGAIIEKPENGKELICHASAWDFCDGQNYRIKMCTQINYEDFITIHHEMGHIQYYLQYAHQPFTFRDGANPGFHEAIGDTIALSVSTPKHLEKINLLRNYNNSYESSINTLMDTALQKIAFLPFGLLVDKWRWDIISGKVDPNQWNSHWWEYRQKYQKIKPPVPRSEDDFDPGAKYHIAADYSYIAYFVADILQFQLYKSLCVAAGEYSVDNPQVPLHECDFYQSKAAGDLLREGLSLGASEHWSHVLKLISGEKKLSTVPLLEYFKPLQEFLKEENAK